jgi:hypothetical protein
LDVVDEGPFALDFDYREPLAVGGLELGDACDVDFRVGRPLCVQNCPGPVAEVAALSRVEDDLRRLDGAYG